MTPADRPSTAGDPVLAKRARFARYVSIGQRLGYGLFGLAVVAFIVGYAAGGPDPWVVTLIVACMVVGSIVLAPAIVFGYGIKAAERADREDSW